MANYYSVYQNGQRIRMTVTHSQSVANNSSSVRVRHYQEVSSGFVADANWRCRTTIGGTSVYDSTAYRDIRSTTLISDKSRTINHNSSGNASVTCAVLSVAQSTNYFNKTVSKTITLPKILRPPTAPTTPVADSITPTGMRVTWAKGSGDAPTSYGFQYSTTSDFSAGVSTVSTTSTTLTLTDLIPGTTYYLRERGSNSAGTGPYSGVGSAMTLPGSPPTISVSPDPSGAFSEVSLALGSLSPTSYTIEWEYLLPEPTPPGADGTATGGNVQIVTDLVPGAVYRWRANATIGSYTTDWSDWIQVLQPDPETAPTIYFDGSFGTDDTPPFTASWEGSPHASVSLRTAPTALGWLQLSHGVSYQIPDPLTGTGNYSVRNLFTESAAGDEWETGYGTNTPEARVDVLEGAEYFARMFVRSSVARQVSLGIAWYDGSGLLSTSWNSAPTMLTESRITQLTTTAVAPAGAIYAAILLTGDAGETWPPNARLDMEGAQMGLAPAYPYFDGRTPSTARDLYAWEGDPDESISSHRVLQSGVPDPFNDPTCPAPPLPPRPPAIDNLCITEVGIWQRYWAPIDRDALSSQLDVLPTFRLFLGGFPSEQIRIRIYENPDNLPADDFIGDDWLSEQIISYAPANSEIVIDALSQSATGRVGSGDWFDIGHLLYGTAGTPASWPVLACSSAYLVAIDVPLEYPLGNITIELDLTTRMG